MASVKLQTNGAEFAKILRRIPVALRDQARPIVQQAAQKALTTIRSDYPEGDTGNLRRGLRIKETSSQFGISVKLLSTAKIAFIFEEGTKRPRQNHHGQNRGVMPASDLFVPTVIQFRKEMIAEVIALVRGQGFDVYGG